MSDSGSSYGEDEIVEQVNGDNSTDGYNEVSNGPEDSVSSDASHDFEAGPEHEYEPEPEIELTPETTSETEPSPEPEVKSAPDPRPSFGFIDAHADTISRALLRDPGERGLYRNSTLDVDFARLAEFDAPVQVFALWLSDRYVSTGFARTNYMIDFFESEVEKHSDFIEIALDLDDIQRIAGEGKISAVLSIEGGEALMGRLDYLDHFYDRGVRMFAPVWNRENELGYGQATGSSHGLKTFGFQVIERMDELGMILDVSHLNEQGFWDAHNTSKRPYIASHSNSYTVMPHARNLTDEQILAVVDSGGLIGFNMFPAIIAPGNRVTLDDVINHFRRFFRIGAGKHIGLGCDFDGIPTMPVGINDVSSLHMFHDLLSDTFGEKRAFDVMEGNFYDFLVRYFEG